MKKIMGIWWGMHIKTMTWEQGPLHGATTENMERYLRFAKEHGIQAVLAEGWNLGWEDWKHFDFTTPYDDWDMDYLSRLADSLGVQIVGHNETGGNAADYEADLDSIYRYHAAHGIHAIKTGYVAPIIRTKDGLQWNKGQSGVRHYRTVIETAAKYHIMIDNHEPVMPTGIGGITDEEAREIEVPLTMLEKDRTYTLTLYRDAEDADWETRPYAYNIEEREVSSDGTLRIRMAPGGGFAAEMKTKN